MAVRSGQRNAAFAGKGKLLGMLLAGGVVLSATPAAAQDATQPETPVTDAPEEGEVVVTGYRASINRSLREKRNANAIVEVITAEDISKFPDKNVADALQRVPGVIISRDGGEGKNVSVRGLASDLTLTQLNGNYVATAETNDTASRSFNYTLLPANMLAGAELFKTPEARLDEGGIGGTVILRTRRPLDIPSLSGFLTVEGTYADTTRKVDPQISGMLSWKNDAETFGLLLGATKQTRTNRTLSTSTEDWRWYSDLQPNNNQAWVDPATDVNGNPFPADFGGYFVGNSGFNDQSHPYAGRPLPSMNWGGGAGGGWSYSPNAVPSFYSGFFMPTAVNFNIRDEKRERLGIQATAQFRPTDNLTLTANYFRFDLDGNYIESQNKVPEWNLARLPLDGNWATGRTLNGLNFDRSGTIVTGAAFETIAGKFYPCNEAQAAAAGLPGGGWGGDSCAMPTPAMRSYYSRESARSQTAEFGAEWQHDQWKASLKAGRTWARGGPEINFYVQAKPRREIGAGVWERGNNFTSWDLTGTPTATFSEDLHKNVLAGMVELDPGSTLSSWQRNKISQNYAQLDLTKSFDSSWLESIQAGVKYRHGKANAQQGNTYWYCPGTERRYQDGCPGLPSPGLAIPGLINASPAKNITGAFNVNVFPTLDVRTYMNHLRDVYGDPVDHPEEQFVYNANEKIWAGYVQANFKTDRLRGNIGLRAIRTNQNVNSTALVTRFTDYFLDDASGRPAVCPSSGTYPAGPDYPAGSCTPGGGITPWGGEGKFTEAFTVSTVGDKFWDFLPSINLAYDLTPNLLLRGAASKVIARPAFSEPDGTTRLRFFSQEYAEDRAGAGGGAAGWTGNGLGTVDPFKATQFDLGLEWYFRPGSVLGAGLFLKRISNFNVPVTRDQELNVEGEVVTVRNFSTTANGRKGVSKGVEVYAQHTFDFGVGFQANYTYNHTNAAEVVIDGETIGSSPLVGSAKSQANATLFYENRDFMIRASYNWRDKVVGGLSNGLTSYLEPYDQVDLNASYTFNDRFTLTASVLNLFKSEQRSHLGNDTKARLLANTYSGRIAFFGATYKFGGPAGR